MKIKTLGFWKSVTTWGGFLITLSGSSYALSMGKLDVVSGCLTFGGLAINGVGNLIGMAQSKREKEAKETAEKRIEELEGIAYEAEEALNDPHFKRLVERERSEYEVAHQDDGR